MKEPGFQVPSTTILPSAPTSMVTVASSSPRVDHGRRNFALKVAGALGLTALVGLALPRVNVEPSGQLSINTGAILPLHPEKTSAANAVIEKIEGKIGEFGTEMATLKSLPEVYAMRDRKVLVLKTILGYVGSRTWTRKDPMTFEQREKSAVAAKLLDPGDLENLCHGVTEEGVRSCKNMENDLLYTTVSLEEIIKHGDLADKMPDPPHDVTASTNTTSR